jgi:hypothetical protein
MFHAKCMTEIILAIAPYDWPSEEMIVQALN